MNIYPSISSIKTYEELEEFGLRENEIRKPLLLSLIGTITPRVDVWNVLKHSNLSDIARRYFNLFLFYSQAAWRKESIVENTFV